MEQLKNLSFDDLVKYNDENFNIPIDVKINEVSKVTVHTMPSYDVLEDIVEIFYNMMRAEYEAQNDPVPILQQYGQLILQSILARKTSSIEINFEDTYGNYIIFHKQLRKNRALRKILTTHGEDIGRIYLTFSEILMDLAKVFNSNEKKMIEEMNKVFQQEEKPKKPRKPRKPKVVN